MAAAVKLQGKEEEEEENTERFLLLCHADIWKVGRDRGVCAH